MIERERTRAPARLPANQPVSQPGQRSARAVYVWGECFARASRRHTHMVLINSIARVQYV